MQSYGAWERERRERLGEEGIEALARFEVACGVRADDRAAIASLIFPTGADPGEADLNLAAEKAAIVDRICTRLEAALRSFKHPHDVRLEVLEEDLEVARRAADRAEELVAA